MRATVIKEEHILPKFQSKHDMLVENGVYEREAMAWTAFDYNNAYQLDMIDAWLSARIAYLDEFFSHDKEELYAVAASETKTHKLEAEFYTNPCNQLLTIDIPSSLYYGSCIITDMYGKVLYDNVLTEYSNVIDTGSWPTGLFKVRIKKGDASQSFTLLRTGQ